MRDIIYSGRSTEEVASLEKATLHLFSRYTIDLNDKREPLRVSSEVYNPRLCDINVRIWAHSGINVVEFEHARNAQKIMELMGSFEFAKFIAITECKLQFGFGNSLYYVHFGGAEDKRGLRTLMEDEAMCKSQGHVCYHDETFANRREGAIWLLKARLTEIEFIDMDGSVGRIPKSKRK